MHTKTSISNQISKKKRTPQKTTSKIKLLPSSNTIKSRNKSLTLEWTTKYRSERELLKFQSFNENQETEGSGSSQGWVVEGELSDFRLCEADHGSKERKEEKEEVGGCRGTMGSAFVRRDAWNRTLMLCFHSSFEKESNVFLFTICPLTFINILILDLFSFLYFCFIY